MRVTEQEIYKTSPELVEQRKIAKKKTLRYHILDAETREFLESRDRDWLAQSLADSISKQTERVVVVVDTQYVEPEPPARNGWEAFWRSLRDVFH